MSERQLPALAEWQVRLLRLTVFPAPDEQLDGMSWWENVVEEEPESINTNKQTGERIFRGSFLKGRLLLSVFPARINWVYSTIDDNVLAEAKIPTLGTLEQEVAEFKSYLGDWLNNGSPDAIRIAFGAQVIQPFDSNKEAYQRLAEYIPVQIDPENSSDFIYRINRRRHTNLDTAINLQLNRISTWSALQAKVGIDAPRPQSIWEKFACQLELDINTVPNPEYFFENDMLVPLFSGLVDLGLEIAEKGDIP